MSILIKGVRLNGETTDIFIEGNRIKEIGGNLEVKADEVIPGAGKAAVPSFINAHTHAATTLARYGRGCAGDGHQGCHQRRLYRSLRSAKGQGADSAQRRALSRPGGVRPPGDLHSGPPRDLYGLGGGVEMVCPISPGEKS